jgi:non-heme chloroperoxidase
VSAVPPLMLKTDKNPEGTPLSVFDGFRAQLAANRAQFFREVPMPFYGFNRPGAQILEGVVDNWWRQGMMGAANAHYLGIKAFSETDQTEDLKAINVPTLVMQGDDDQIVPYTDAVLLQAKLIKRSTLKVYPGYPQAAKDNKVSKRRTISGGMRCLRERPTLYSTARKWGGGGPSGR